MDINSISVLFNDRILRSTCFYKLFKYFVIALILNCLINALNFGFLMMWIIELKIGF